MKNLKAILSVACIMSAGVFNAFGWGQRGHDVVCTIAENHLTAKAARKINAILDGKSIVYWANWMDSASHTPQYSYTSTWHYKNIDADESYDNCKENPAGDVLTAIDAQVRALKSGELDKEHQALALKMLVHFVGDLHCPMHMGHLSDRGGNGHQLKFFNRGTNLHSIWDSAIVEGIHGWSCSEWAKEIDTASRKEIAAITAGTPSDWGRETYAIATAIYEDTPIGAKLGYDYLNKWGPTVEVQLEKGGLRLASILNDIFK